eukprot:Nk52_evm4s372 gene=Nk52_evmTU4s372
MPMDTSVTRVGIIGFGHLGKYLAEAVVNEPSLELAFVWNRTAAPVLENDNVKDVYLENLEDVPGRFNKLGTDGKARLDLVVEVAHPSIIIKHLEMLLTASDVMVGSPTAFADPSCENILKQYSGASAGKYNTLYIPSGAMWGANDIQKMADRDTLKGLTVTMKKHPSCFKFNCPVLEDLAKKSLAEGKAIAAYSGSVRELCPKAPNNVNTMAAAAISAHNLGFDKVGAKLVLDPSLDVHVVEVEVIGPGGPDAPPFTVKTTRSNYAKVGAVTGQATYASFYSSMMRGQGFPRGVHLI